MWTSLQVIMSVDLNKTDKPQIRYSAFYQTLEKKWEYITTLQLLFMKYERAYNSVSIEVLYNILKSVYRWNKLG